MMNTEKEIKAAARVVRQLDTYIKDLEKQKGATPKAKAKAIPIPEGRKKAYVSIILFLSRYDKQLNQPKPVDRRAKWPISVPGPIKEEKIRIITGEPRVNIVK